MVTMPLMPAVATRAPRQLPGLHSPAAGFDQPFEMLAACHERLARTLALLGRLLDHLDNGAADGNARSAASAVWRYFELAAPQHHRDEELHLLPRMRASGHPALQAAAAQMLDDHAAFRAQWQRLGPALAALRDGDPPAAATLRALAEPFIRRHGSHLALENGLAYPAVAAQLGASDRAAMGAEMARRRDVRTTG
ncbi:MAG: hemerythrin [Burkholderiales bacterium PBB5]|nr:MAG: hemerythrin [Burkholderiales bacterium PBB5]